MPSSKHTRVLLLPEQITAKNANSVLIDIMNQPTPDMRIDLSSVQHCDSAGIAALLEAKSLFLLQQRVIDFIAPREQMVNLATFLKVDNILFSTPC